MPNAKLYIDQTVWETQQTDFKQSLPKIRETLCQYLTVPPTACQLALLPVYGLSDQPAVNIELHLMPNPDRTPDLICELTSELQKTIMSLSQSRCAVRITTLNPETYSVMK